MPSLELKEILDQTKLPDYIKAVNQTLESVAKTANPALRKPLLRVIGAKSKRLRPALLFASAGGKLNNELVLAGAAIELVHLGSLIHDDIIDGAGKRWGKPSISKTEGPSTALLAGDYLLAAASSTVAKVNDAAALLIADTILSLINGESLEANDDYNLYRTEKSYLDCVQAKTAELISAACLLGGIFAGLGQPQTKALGIYGNHLGIAFQIIDDLLDITSNPKLMGKPTGNDARNGIYTLPVIYSLHSGNSRKLKKLLKDPKFSNKDLADLLISDGSIQKSLQQVDKYNLAAQNSAKNAGLQYLPSAYLDWALNNLVLKEYQSQIL